EMNKPGVVALVDGERALLQTRASELAGQKTLLRSQTEQIQRQLEGLKAQQAAMDESSALLGRDLTDVDALYSKKLVSKERLSNVRLDATRAKGESGRLAAAVA
ncbi:HlyD family type I secretion periplasmic adaptor subunit, partial [bacterium M00.F.Ca.ET.221.01.1.1]